MLLRDELKRLREAAGLSQEMLARKASVSVGTVRSCEQGRRLLSFPVVVKLAKALNVSVATFAACSDVASGEK
ncbi:MAG: helix-turn-helix transcriptional regulator [Gemmataceae bacterium]